MRDRDLQRGLNRAETADLREFLAGVPDALPFWEAHGLQCGCFKRRTIAQLPGLIDQLRALTPHALPGDGVDQYKSAISTICDIANHIRVGRAFNRTACELSPAIGKAWRNANCGCEKLCKCWTAVKPSKSAGRFQGLCTPEFPVGPIQSPQREFVRLIVPGCRERVAT